MKHQRFKSEPLGNQQDEEDEYSDDADHQE